MEPLESLELLEETVTWALQAGMAWMISMVLEEQVEEMEEMVTWALLAEMAGMDSSVLKEHVEETEATALWALLVEMVFLVLGELAEEMEEMEETVTWALQVFQQDWTWKGFATLKIGGSGGIPNMQFPTSSKLSRVVCRQTCHLLSFHP